MYIKLIKIRYWMTLDDLYSGGGSNSPRGLCVCVSHGVTRVIRFAGNYSDTDLWIKSYW